MEHTVVKFNDIDRFEYVIGNSLPDNGDLEIITKDVGLKSGRGIVTVTFTVELPDGSVKRVQTVTTMRNFRVIASAILATYDDDGFRINMADPLDDGVIDG